jgi:hypothetical protein
MTAPSPTGLPEPFGKRPGSKARDNGDYTPRRTHRLADIPIVPLIAGSEWVHFYPPVVAEGLAYQQHRHRTVKRFIPSVSTSSAWRRTPSQQVA